MRQQNKETVLHLNSSKQSFLLQLRGAAVAALMASGPVYAQTTPEDVSFVNSQGVRITAKLYTTVWIGRRPAVVLMHGCSGIYSSSDPVQGVASLYSEWATRLNKAGYVALLVDSFSARGVPQDQCSNGSAGVSEVSDRPRDAYGALSFLVSSPRVAVDATKVFALGWSHGGSSVFSTMSDTVPKRKDGRFRGGFSFYPGCGLYNAFGGISTSTYLNYAPLLLLHGTADPLYTSGYCQTRLDRAVARGGDMQMRAYSGAQHSFDMAKAITGKWTIYDVNAKIAADAEVMNRLEVLSQ